MNESRTVRDLMASEVATLEISDRLDLASDIMTLGRVRHLPVVQGQRLVGILSQRDLFRAAVSSVVSSGPVSERRWLGTIAVQDVMSREPITASPDWDVSQAVELMLARRIGCLPVVENGELVGLLSETDCLRLLAQMLGR